MMLILRKSRRAFGHYDVKTLAQKPQPLNNLEVERRMSSMPKMLPIKEPHERRPERNLGRKNAQLRKKRGE